MKLGSLFSGAGLGDLGWMMAGFEIAWQVEIDKYCQKILDLRFPESTKYHDIKTLKGCEVEPVDIVAGGFPCQPFSVAGKQGGDQDDRNLWPQMLRVIKEVRPTWVVGENVSGLIPIYLDTVLNGLESEGYSTRTFVFPAHSLGANHRRERIWVVGYSARKGLERNARPKLSRESKGLTMPGQNVANPAQDSRRICNGNSQNDVADTESKTSMRGNREFQRNSKEKRFGSDNRKGTSCFSRWWKTEPSVGRVVDGMPHRVDRLKALGNGQVVSCTAFIGQQIMEFERLKNESHRH